MKLSTVPKLLTMACTALVIAALATPTQAQNLRSWDKKIEDVNKRFRILASFNNEAVLDTETQLVWQRTPFPFSIAQLSAVSECGRAGIGGVKGWRLPSLHELNSLLRPTPETGIPGSASLPNGHAFEGVLDDFYWSSSLVSSAQDQTSNFWVQNVSDGSIERRGRGSEISVKQWCVRGGGPISAM